MQAVALRPGKEEINKADKKSVDEKRLENEARLHKLGELVGKKRDEAVSARRTSGIERIWIEDTEYYEGIDDANRQNHTYTKSWSPNGGLTSNISTQGQQGEKGKCTAFFNITRQFVDSASARMGDILLPEGDWNFSIAPTPISDMAEIKGSVQAVVDENGQNIKKSDGTDYTLGEFANQEQLDAEKKVKKAETRIHDDLTECHYKAELRKVIEDAARIGSGIIRGPYPVKRIAKAVIDGVFVVEEKIAPGSKHVSPHNFFPDPNCGDNIHDGGYCVERDFLSSSQLRDLIGVPGYQSKQILKAIEEGPGKKHADEVESVSKNDERFEIWYYYGEVDMKDMEACGCKVHDDSPDFAYAVVVLINDTVIKGYMNPNTSGEFPYDLMPWQRRAGSPFGIGVSRQGRVSQDMLNASARSLMQNTGLSSAPQLILMQGKIIPADGDYNMYGGKTWIAVEDEGVEKVTDAITAINIPSNQAELVNLMQVAQKMMEDSTGVTFLLQGQQGGAPDTVGGMELLHKNASALLRRIARVFDETITEPHIRRYYDWILIHGNDDEKGDMEITAIGSSALVEREIQAMQSVQILNMSLNPAFGYSPKKAANEVLRAWRFEPSKFEMDEKEKQAMQQVPQAPIPAVEVAKIRTASAEKVADMRMQSSERKTVEDMDRDEIYQKTLADRSEKEFAARREELTLRRELAMMDYANKHEISLERVKADLAKTTMRLRTQKELAATDGSAPQVAVPAVEPVGRAPDGEAFQK